MKLGKETKDCKKASEPWQDSEKMYRDLFENAPSAYLTFLGTGLNRTRKGRTRNIIGPADFPKWAIFPVDMYQKIDTIPGMVLSCEKSSIPGRPNNPFSTG